jgi:hypothetical protein
MTVDDFRKSLTESEPPAELNLALDAGVQLWRSVNQTPLAYAS